MCDWVVQLTDDMEIVEAAWNVVNEGRASDLRREGCRGGNDGSFDGRSKSMPIQDQVVNLNGCKRRVSGLFATCCDSLDVGN